MDQNKTSKFCFTPSESVPKPYIGHDIRSRSLRYAVSLILPSGMISLIYLSLLLGQWMDDTPVPLQ